MLDTVVRSVADILFRTLTYFPIHCQRQFMFLFNSTFSFHTTRTTVHIYEDTRRSASPSRHLWRHASEREPKSTFMETRVGARAQVHIYGDTRRSASPSPRWMHVKENVVAYFKLLSQHLLGTTEKNNKKSQRNFRVQIRTRDIANVEQDG